MRPKSAFRRGLFLDILIFRKHRALYLLRYAKAELLDLHDRCREVHQAKNRCTQQYRQSSRNFNVAFFRLLPSGTLIDQQQMRSDFEGEANCFAFSRSQLQ